MNGTRVAPRLGAGAGGGPAVVLDAHHDVVALRPKDQPIEALVADGRVGCPGASDDLSGTVRMLLPRLPGGVGRRRLPHAVDALAQVTVRVRKEVWDPRTAEVDFRAAGEMADPPVLYLNMAEIAALPIMNAPASEAETASPRT